MSKQSHDIGEKCTQPKESKKTDTVLLVISITMPA